MPLHGWLVLSLFLDDNFINQDYYGSSPWWLPPWCANPHGIVIEHLSLVTRWGEEGLRDDLFPPTRSVGISATMHQFHNSGYRKKKRWDWRLFIRRVDRTITFFFIAPSPVLGGRGRAWIILIKDMHIPGKKDFISWMTEKLMFDTRRPLCSSCIIMKLMSSSESDSTSQGLHKTIQRELMTSLILPGSGVGCNAKCTVP